MDTIHKMDQLNPFDILGRLGLTMTGIFSLVTLIDPQWLTLAFTAFAAVPTGLYYLAKREKTNLEIRQMKEQYEEAEEEKKVI